MAPSLRTSIALALAYIGGALAKQWKLQETFDKTNFFDNFNFESGGDGTLGHVNYTTREQATSLGLIGIDGDDVVLRPDYKNIAPVSPHYWNNPKTNGIGRHSVRISSKQTYEHALFIARFSKLPTPTCGVRPEFYTYGSPWVAGGEIDILQQWNDLLQNLPAVHTGMSAQVGTCVVDQRDMTGTVLTSNCDNTHINPPSQTQWQGCTVRDNGPWGSKTVYAMELTSGYLKIYSFFPGNLPADIESDTPDTSSWGQPTLMIKNQLCDIGDHFSAQKLALGVNFCGVPCGSSRKESYYWVEESGCATKTGYNTCVEYVSKNPGAFADAYFKIRDIRIFVE
ncbi:concanavalin A-like lectin/glucanase [Xylariaceae sp. FL0662B]|nr:concanavalin A-like lectin/glucanase [Xylariaceae sp. FL0662B]